MKTYDIFFNSDDSSDNMGFTINIIDAEDYIERHNGTLHGYFKDYKGGEVSIVCNETEETIFSTEIF